MSWQECAAEHCHSDSSPDGRYCAACADQMVATGRPMQLAWRLLKTNPDDLFDAEGNFNPLRARSTPPQKSRVDLCGEKGCNEPAVGVDGIGYGAMRLCQGCLDEHYAAMRRVAGLSPRGEE